ncbi:hypothetical protein [Mycobacterium camsae]|uniref:hypothetical protein n=1 Tax=Mycobacterium gordonae TaxID=1778 RepID=UPI001981769B|nr:hypothetical protein [Mycobacterium gordonae]
MARPQKSNVYKANAAALSDVAKATRAIGAKILNAAGQVHNTVCGLDWQGQGKIGAQRRADRELVQDRKVQAGHDALADAYENGSTTMQPMIDSLREQGQGLEADRFDVSEDWKVTDKYDYQAGKATMIHHGASEQAATDRMKQLASDRGNEAATRLRRCSDWLMSSASQTRTPRLTSLTPRPTSRRPHRRSAVSPVAHKQRRILPMPGWAKQIPTNWPGCGPHHHVDP